MKKADAREWIREALPDSELMQLLNDCFQGMVTQKDIEPGKDALVLEWDTDKFYDRVAEALSEDG